MYQNHLLMKTLINHASRQVFALKAAVFVVALMFSLKAFAHLFKAPVDIASWNAQVSPLMCSIWHEIPGYGVARFRHRAGETLTFRLETQRKVVNDEVAHLRAQPPAWKADWSERDLGKFKTLLGNTPIELAEPRSSRVLAELQLGMFPTIHHGGWFPGHRVNIQVSSVNFGKAYLEYLDCVAGLFDANFDQLERTSLYFDTDKWIIKSEYKERLKLIKEYIDIDRRVKKIFVDGHTDNVGRMGYNWDLSRNRAEAAEAYLKSLGVKEDMVVVRYHGEQFPVVKNNTAANRSRNRRVTIRLDMSEADKLKMR